YALGGPVDRRNLFPQHRGSNRNADERHALIDWVEFEKSLREYMSQNQRGKIEYKVLFHFPAPRSTTSGSRPDRNRPADPTRYEVNRPNKFEFYAKLYKDDNTAEFECEFHMSNNKDGFSLPSAKALNSKY
uniref:Uncharacterized protein n=1 Tax=Romanomermis culicivorax TaxID=13658 RepID=A0A915KUD6_ROMCU